MEHTCILEHACILYSGQGSCQFPTPTERPRRAWVQVLRLRAVLLVEAPSDPADLSTRTLRYEAAIKTYFFHYHR